MVVLVIAPHPDDEVLGCGGTIAKHVACGDEVYVAIVTKGTEPVFSPKSVEMVREECLKANSFLGVKHTLFMDFPAAMLENIKRYQFNQAFIDLVQDIKPEIVYIPHRGDMQLDHKITVDAMMVALRPKYQHRVNKILAYETLSETGWDIPNLTNEFIPVSYNDISVYIDTKLEAMKIYSTQLATYPNARSLEAIKALAVFRGVTIGVEAAEAFVVIREVM